MQIQPTIFVTSVSRRFVRGVVPWAFLCLGSHVPGAPGDLDVGWGEGGTVTAELVPRSAHLGSAWTDVVVQSDSKIVVAGVLGEKVGASVIPQVVAARYLPSGQLDPEFGVGGVVKGTGTLKPQSNTFVKLAIQSDGKLLLALTDTISTSSNQTAVARLVQNGALDSDFGVAGIAVLPSPPPSSNPYHVPAGVHQLPSGEIVGAVRYFSFPSVHFLRQFKMDSAGHMISFGVSMPASATLGHQTFQGGSFLIDGNQGITMATTALWNSTTGFAIAGFLSDGTPKPGFGTNGITLSQIGVQDSSTLGNASTCIGLASDSLDRWIVVGEGTDVVTSPRRIILARYLSNGTLDPSFDDDGVLYDSGPSILGGTPFDVICDDSDRIVICGQISTGTGTRFALLRFFVTGLPDVSFGVNGVGAPVSPLARTANAMAVDAEGRILVVGDSMDGPIIARYWAGDGTEPLALFGEWAANHGLSGNGATVTGIPFADGVANLLKYAFNMSGSGPDLAVMAPDGGASGLPSIRRLDQGSSGVLRFEFVRRLVGGLVYTPMVSSSLESDSWIPVIVEPVIDPIDAQWERVTFDFPFDPSTTESLFGAVEVRLGS